MKAMSEIVSVCLIWAGRFPLNYLDYSLLFSLSFCFHQIRNVEEDCKLIMCVICS